MIEVHEYKIYEVSTGEVVNILPGSMEYISHVCQTENETRRVKGLPWVTFEEIDMNKTKRSERVN